MATGGKRGVERFLDVVERVGNLLPHPVTLFAGMAVLVLFVSALGAWAGLSVLHPTTGAPIHAVNLLGVEGLHRIANNLCGACAFSAAVGSSVALGPSGFGCVGLGMLPAIG